MASANLNQNIELSREQIRAIILFEFKLDKTIDECYQQLVQAFGMDITSLATVKNWYREFRRRIFHLSDQPRPGTPMTASTQKKIDAIHHMIEEDKHITYRHMQHELGISNDVIHFIIHELLHLRKICARWIPHQLRPDQKVARIQWCKTMRKRFKNGASPLISKIITGDETWIYHYDPESKEQSRQWTPIGEPPPQKLKKSQFSKKQMYAIFFDTKGIRGVQPL